MLLKAGKDRGGEVANIFLGQMEKDIQADLGIGKDD